jgi:hypothetical protein
MRVRGVSIADKVTVSGFMVVLVLGVFLLGLILGGIY